MPVVPVNYLAVLVCGIAAMVLGFLWYGPLFGKKWATLEGMDMNMMKNPTPEQKKKMYRGYAIQFVAALVMAFVLEHSLIFAAAYMHVSGVSAGLQAGLWSWLGFIAPATLGMVLWEMKPWVLWIIVSGYWLALLLISGVILALWM
jgi:hypothetical protein